MHIYTLQEVWRAHTRATTGTLQQSEGSNGCGSRRPAATPIAVDWTGTSKRWEKAQRVTNKDELLQWNRLWWRRYTCAKEKEVKSVKTLTRQFLLCKWWRLLFVDRHSTVWCIVQVYIVKNCSCSSKTDCSLKEIDILWKFWNDYLTAYYYCSACGRKER